MDKDEAQGEDNSAWGPAGLVSSSRMVDSGRVMYSKLLFGKSLPDEPMSVDEYTACQFRVN